MLAAAVDALTCILQSVVLRSYLLTTDFQQLAQLHAPYPMGFLPTTNPPTPLQLLEACQWQPSLARYPEVVLPIFFQYRQTKPLRHDNRLSLAAKLWLLGEDWSAYYFILGRTFNPLTLSPKEAITLAQHPLVKAALLTGQPLNPIPHTLPPQPSPTKLRFRPVTSPAERIAYLLSSETPFHIYLLNKSIAEMQKVRYTKSDLHIRTDARRAQRNRQPYMPLLDLPNRYAQTPLDAVEAVAFQALLPLDSPTRALISRLT